MKTIKALWNKFKTFVINLFKSKLTKAKEEGVALDKKIVETIDEINKIDAEIVATMRSQFVAEEATTPEEDENGKILDRILILTKQHGYFLSEAMSAYGKGDTLGLARIEKQMLDGTYKDKENVSDAVKRFRARQELQAKIKREKAGKGFPNLYSVN